MTNQHNTDQRMNSSNADDNDNKKDTFQCASTNAMAMAVIVMVHRLIRAPLFSLGQVVATPGALDLLDRTGTNASTLLERHRRGDWGVVCESDAAENNQAVADGERILSAYEVGEQRERLWIITEHDRSVTTLLLPEEY